MHNVLFFLTLTFVKQLSYTNVLSIFAQMCICLQTKNKENCYFIMVTALRDISSIIKIRLNEDRH